MTAVAEASFEKTSLIQGVLDAYRHKDRNNSRCVLFVHGLTGHPEITWKDTSSAQSFLELLLNDENLQDYDVFSFGYRSKYVRGAPIEHAAKQLYSAIEELAQNHYSIVLIAHSMGGLVCMRYILDRLELGETPPITGLLLYGTPTTGSELVNVARLVGFGLGVRVPIIRAIVNLFFRAQRQVADLATGSEFLARLHDGWAFRVVNGGHEKAGAGRMWLPVRVVTGADDTFVSEASGKGMYGAIDWIPLDCGHVRLVKPTGANDPSYVRARSFLQICRQAKERDVLERIWQASQEVWASRVARVTEDLEFRTVINEPGSSPGVVYSELRDYSSSIVTCEYDIVLEGKEIEFGISIGHHEQEEIWGRSPQPVYVHQIRLARLPEAERGRLTSTIEAILADGDDERVWSRLFPEVSLTINRQKLLPANLVWQVPEERRYSNWLLRRYLLPSNIIPYVGLKVKLRIHYRSIVPLSLGYFSFSTPWIVNRARVTATIFGDFEYLVPSHRLTPRANVNFQESSRGDRREIAFVHKGIMLPGSVVEVHWQTRRSSVPERKSEASPARADASGK